MKRWIAVAGVVVGAGFVLWAILGGPNDEERIRAQLERLEAAAHVEGDGENPVFRSARLNQEFSEIFTDDVAVSIPELSSHKRGRTGLAALAARATTHVRNLDVDFSSIDVQFDTSGKSASVDTDAKLDATRHGGRIERDERRVAFRFVERDGDWLIDSVSVYPPGEEHVEAE
jgi:uncharacterized protein (TIGR02246 family)